MTVKLFAIPGPADSSGNVKIEHLAVEIGAPLVMCQRGHVYMLPVYHGPDLPRCPHCMLSAILSAPPRPRP